VCGLLKTICWSILLRICCPECLQSCRSYFNGCWFCQVSSVWFSASLFPLQIGCSLCVTLFPCKLMIRKAVKRDCPFQQVSTAFLMVIICQMVCCWSSTESGEPLFTFASLIIPIYSSNIFSSFGEQLMLFCSFILSRLITNVAASRDCMDFHAPRYS